MENQMYLTPSQVEELRELGVEFKDSKMVWKISENHQNIEIRNSIGDWASDVGVVKWETIYAPSMQEVMDKLPKQFHDGKNCHCLILDYATNTIYYYDAIKNLYPYNSKVSSSFSLDNPLLATFELLKWVATNHPEALKGGAQ